MTELTDIAKAIRTGIFFIPSATLTMHNEHSEMTPEAAAAMKELVDGGFVAVEPNGKCQTYSLTDDGAKLPRQSLAWMRKHGTRPLMQPICKDQAND